MKRVLVVYGTRPEAIKLAPVVAALERHPGLDPVVVVTGQHREMLDQVNELFGIEPVHDLDLMRPGASLADLSARALASLDGILDRELPDALVVQGDTSTAFIAGLAAFYRRIPVIHVEAGLRTRNLQSPFPEEANRQLLGRITSLHLAPTDVSRANLIREAVQPEAIAVTGNTVIDALQQALMIPPSIREPRLAELIRSRAAFVLVTAHRRESWGERMHQAMLGLRDAADRNPDVVWVLPMHRNPLVRDPIRSVLGSSPQVLLCEPLDYHEFCHTMRAATLLLSDSGGVQEEAPSLGKPVLVMRDTTERPEAVSAGAVRLVGTDRQKITDGLDLLLNDQREYQKMARAVNPFGDGRAAARTVAALAHFFGLGPRLPDFVPGGED